MNHFGGKEIAQIDPDEIKALVDNRVPEDQHLDYKQVPWKETDDGRRELLHDVTALANAKGGYLVVGLGTNKVGGQDVPSGFAPLQRPGKLAKRILDICFHYVDPRMQGLEAGPVLVPLARGSEDATVVLVHIPPSNQRPHGFDWGDATTFVRRYGAHVRRMPVSELGEMFSVRYFPETETSRQLAQLSQEVARLREAVEELKGD